MNATNISLKSNSPKKKPSLRRTWARLRTVPGLGRDVSALVVVIILAMVTLSIILNGEKVHFPWSPQRATYTLTFRNAVSVSPGNGQQVRIAGVDVGAITASKPAAGGTASLVTVALDPGHPLYSNASAVLTPINPLNEMYIEIDPGGPPGKRLANHGVVPVTQTQSPVQLDSVLDHLNNDTLQATTTLIDTSAVALASAPSSLPGGLAGADTTLNRLQPVVSALQARRQQISELVTALTQISEAAGSNDQQLAGLVDSTQQTLGVLSQHDSQLSATLSELPGVTGTLRHAMTSTGTLTTQLNPVLSQVTSASKALPGTLQDLTNVVHQLGTTVAAATPVVAKAGPVVTALRPIATNTESSLNNLKPITACLPQAISKIAPWMYDLAAFIYNTNSSFSTTAAGQGQIPRGLLAVNLTDPTAKFVGTTSNQTGTYQQGGSPLGPYPGIGGSC